ncbi:hypothetical protein B0T20DRAFT_475224 [Sordaria brevicollis]|uniref:Uncharacterized protein n=1 Tax=Sordaria brevicollis TaxID=83679 RepID=A0AAE0PP34_SORBR|nr:hypothetical protein B0T20DRAFT_475224 [Sordaria brevicollis]
MHLITALSLLTALAAASPIINSPRNPDSAPAAAINKRLANSPWIWLKKAESEQFEDSEQASTDNGAAAINKRLANSPWIWLKKAESEEFEDSDQAVDNGAEAVANSDKVKRFAASVPWIWRPKKVDFEQFEDDAADADAAGEGKEGEQK